MENLSKTTQAIILLCSYLGLNSREVKPYTPLQWSKLAEDIYNSSLKEPGALFNLESEDISRELNRPISDGNRISKLLSRGINLSFCLEDLELKSIYIVTKNNENYPKRIKSLLARNSVPPVLYYCGDLSLANTDGIAIVGSRNIDKIGAQYAHDLAAWAAQNGLTVYSGGARGIDSISSSSALNNGGCCVEILADSMLRKIKNIDDVEAISEGRKLMISLFHPETGFNVANAMTRNKYIYILSKAAFVIASDLNKGGTWTGATENLKRHWVPLYVWNNTKYLGNRELIKLGAKEIPLFDNLNIKNLNSPIEESEYNLFEDF